MTKKDFFLFRRMNLEMFASWKCRWLDMGGWVLSSKGFPSVSTSIRSLVLVLDRRVGLLVALNSSVLDTDPRHTLETKISYSKCVVDCWVSVQNN